MRIAVLTPLPPVRSGIARYSSLMLPLLQKSHEVTAVAEQQEIDAVPFPVISPSELQARAAEFDAVIAQLGNNPHHEFAYRYAVSNPTHAVLHDAVLHHLAVEMTLARGEADEYAGLMTRNHGRPGAAAARGRVAGLHNEIVNFFFPASTEVANRSRSVMVHNHYAGERLRAAGVTRPIVVAPLYFPVTPAAREDGGLRSRLGISATSRVIGVFGFLTAAKRPEVLLRSFARARERDPRLVLLIVGEIGPSVPLDQMLREMSIPDAACIITGYVRDEEFESYLAAADRIVNLRYPSAGEGSAAIATIFGVGKPVAVSDYAQFSEYPADVVTHIPFGEDEVEALVAFMTEPDSKFSSVAGAQRRWLAENVSAEVALAAYERLLREANDVPFLRDKAFPLPIFPALRLTSVRRSAAALQLTLTNEGATTIRSIVYGEPGYRILARVISAEERVETRRLLLPCDLPPAADCDLRIETTSSARRLELFHGLEGIPQFPRAPFSVWEDA